MILFLPVSRYRVSYDLCVGRPFSRFDHLVLRAISEGCGDLDNLNVMFRMHRSVLVGTVVTLVQSGWVGLKSMPSQSAYMVTPLGRDVLDHPDSLPPNTTVTRRTAWVVMERLEGQLARKGEVQLWSRPKLVKTVPEIWDRGLQLHRSDIKHMPEPGLVRPLLDARADEGSFIQTIGPITVDRDGADFLPLLVDLETYQCIGLPSAWELLLADEMVDVARRHSGSSEARSSESVIEERHWFDVAVRHAAGGPQNRIWGASGRSDASSPPSVDSVAHNRDEEDVIDVDSLERDDVTECNHNWIEGITEWHALVGAEDHSGEMRRALKEAQSLLVIATPSVSETYVRTQLMPHVTRALSRGVSIDILWWNDVNSGVTDEDFRRGIELLRQMHEASINSPLEGRLMVAHQASRLRTGALLFDTSRSRVSAECVLGACSWLGGVDVSSGPSIAISDPRVVARVSRIFLDRLREDDALAHSRTCDALARMGGRLESEEVSPGTSERASLVIGREHFAWLRRLARTVSPKSIQVSLPATAGLEKRLNKFVADLADVYGSVKTTLDSHYNESASRAGQEVILDKMVSVRERGDCSSSVACVGENCITVSSFDWSQPQCAPTWRDEFHIGITLFGPGVDSAEVWCS